jgi:broad specificity phosphatase PhoE
VWGKVKKTIEMSKIYLARHGQNVDNLNSILNGHRDLPLTDLGRKQAKNLAYHIKDAAIDFGVVYSSPLSRALETAQIITDVLGYSPPTIISDLIERDFGTMTGKPIADIEKLCSPRIIKADPITYFIDPEGAETFPDLVVRGSRILDFLFKKHSDTNVLLVCHGDIGKMIYAAFHNLDWKQVLMRFHFGNSELVLLDEKSNPYDPRVFFQDQVNH